MQELPGITDTLAPIGMGGQGLVAIPLTAAQIATPSSTILGNLGATYYLNVYPYTHYQSDGSTLAAIGNTGVSLQTVNGLVAAGVNTAQNRALQYGNMPAANAMVQSGPYANLTVEQALTAINVALSTAGGSAPVNTVQPVAATGTATVGSLQTGATGTWTGASTYLYRWYQQNAATGVRTLITGATSSTYTAQAADFGFKLIYDVAGVSATFVTAAYVFAAGPTATIGSTLATNTGAVPAITGSATAGSTLSLAMGGWTGATNGWSAQWYVAGIASGAPTAVSLTTPITFVTDNTMVGKVVSAIVYGYNSFNVPSASPGITATGPVTVTGAAPSVVNTAVPLWPGTLQLEVQAAFTQGTWTGTINAGRTWNFYRNGTAPANLVRAGNTVALFTPHASEGVLVGDTLYIIEFVTETATGLVSQAVSAGKVVAATPVALAASTAQTGLAWTAGSAITAVIPVTATGGTTPYTFTISPALPTGLSLNASTGQITGTPTTAGSLTTYTVTVTDAVAATSPATFTATVSASSVTPLPPVILPVTLGSYPTTIQYGLKTSSVDFEGGGQDIDPITGQTITRGDGSPLLKFYPNFQSSGRTWALHQIKAGDPTNFSGIRAELSISDTGSSWGNSATGVILPGVDTWWARDYIFGPDLGADGVGLWPAANGVTSDQCVITQYQRFPGHPAGDGPPLALIFRASDRSLRLESDTGTGGGSTTHVVAWIGGGTVTIPANGSHMRVVCHIRTGYNTSFAPRMEMWINGTKVLDQSGAGAFCSTPEDGPLYIKTGIYKFSDLSFPTVPTRQMIASPLCFGLGANLFNEATAAIA